MKEIEVKILEIDKKKVIKTLLDLGAKKKFEGIMNSIYLISNLNPKSKTKMLRIRQKGHRVLLTLKIRREDSEVKISDEYEIEVEYFERIKIIFQNIGFKEYASDFRKRISYQIKNSLVEIDIYKTIPTFLEIESPTKEELKRIVKILGFEFNQTKRWTGKEVLNYYLKQSK